MIAGVKGGNPCLFRRRFQERVHRFPLSDGRVAHDLHHGHRGVIRFVNRLREEIGEFVRYLLNEMARGSESPS